MIMQNDKTYSRVRELETIVGREQDRMFRFAYMRVGNRADAEDIVQDVFLKLFRSGENLSHVRNLQHYLFRSINNACRDFLRRKNYNMIPIENAGAMEVPEDDRQMHEEYRRIGRLLEKLSEEQAEVIRLKCSDGLKFREIAKLLDIPLATAKSRYRYAIEHIRQEL